MIQIAFREPFRHREILIQIVAAVSCRGARNITFKVPDEFKHSCDEIHNIFRLQISFKNYIAAGPAAHGAKIDHAVHPLRIVAKERSPQMLDRMQLRRIHDRLPVRRRHPQVKGCQRYIAEMVFPGYINSRLEFQMVYCKTCDLLHTFPFLERHRPRRSRRRPRERCAFRRPADDGRGQSGAPYLNKSMLTLPCSNRL